MRKILFLLGALSVFLFAFNKPIEAQYTVNIQVFDPLPEIDWAAFIYANNLEGMPRIMRVTINPKGDLIKFQGRVQWKKNDGVAFQDMLTFTTEPFLARDFYNDEIGNSEIRVENVETNSDLISENVQLGRPAGSYRIIGSVLTPEGEALATDSKDMELTNPSQTITILSPSQESLQDPLSVMASWSQVLGASSYKVIANVRKNKSESFEEALKSGTPYIDKDVGNITVVNLRNLLDREWLPGDEIVLQVIAIIPGPGGNNELASDIINFHLMSLQPETIEFINSNFEEVFLFFDDAVAYDFLNRLRNGSLQIKNIIGPDGKPLTSSEIISFIEYLKNNPNGIINFRKL
ncbi:MAG: hypothetical protein GXO87_05590 [Chlorobi bacterium]|nr:hypothetical protein [Chlorobiota bacterium]